MDNNHIIWGNVKEWNNFILVLAKFRCWFWICLLLISLWCFRKCADTSNSHAEKWVVTTEEFSYFMALILKAANRPLRTSLCTNHLTSPPCTVKCQIKLSSTGNAEVVWQQDYETAQQTLSQLSTYGRAGIGNVL